MAVAKPTIIKEPMMALASPRVPLHPAAKFQVWLRQSVKVFQALLLGTG